MNKFKILSLGLFVITLSSCSLSGSKGDQTDGDKEDPDSKIYYNVSFYNDDQVTLLYSSKVEKGATAIYGGTTPTKISEDPSLYYTFTGWDKSLSNIVENTSFFATYEQKVYEFKCTFNNYDASMLYETFVQYGKDVTYKGETPVKTGADGDIYTFTGWDKELTSIKEDTVFTALFSKQKEEYDVRFVNYDDTLLYATTVKHGGEVTYKGKTPERTKTEKFTYVFKGWDKALTSIKTDTTIKAQYDETLNKFKCTFYNGDKATLLKTYDVEYGKDVTYDGAVPTKVESGHSYTFTKWDKELTNIKTDTNFYPEFNDALNKYKVGFYSDDTLTTLLYTASDVAHGTEAIYVGETPTKPDDEYFTYSFSGWSESVVSVTKNMNVYAMFSKTRIEESLTVKSPTSTDMGYTIVEPISGSNYTKNYTYTPLKDSSTYAFDYLGTLDNGDIYQYYYCQIWESVVKFDLSNKNVTDSVSYGDGTSDFIFATIDLSKYNSTFSYSVAFLMSGVQMFRNDNPRTYYLLGNIAYSSIGSKYRNVMLIMDNAYLSADARTSHFSKIDAYVNGVESSVSALSGEAKARAVYDKIIADTTYTNTGITDEHNVLGIAASTGAVCEGYSLMYALCSYRVNIETIWYVGLANGSSGWEGHAWNASKFGGTWYWIDTTWGEANADKYFKTPDSEFSLTHKISTVENDDFDYLPKPSPLA